MEGSIAYKFKTSTNGALRAVILPDDVTAVYTQLQWTDWPVSTEELFALPTRLAIWIAGGLLSWLILLTVLHSSS